MRYVALFLCICFLSACGVKPGHVDPPAGAKDNNFPKTYPSQ